jgi:hypothetical protein
VLVDQGPIRVPHGCAEPLLNLGEDDTGVTRGLRLACNLGDLPHTEEISLKDLPLGSQNGTICIKQLGVNREELVREVILACGLRKAIDRKSTQPALIVSRRSCEQNVVTVNTEKGVGKFMMPEVAALQCSVYQNALKCLGASKCVDPCSEIDDTQDGKGKYIPHQLAIALTYWFWQQGTQVGIEGSRYGGLEPF